MDRTDQLGHDFQAWLKGASVREVVVLLSSIERELGQRGLPGRVPLSSVIEQLAGLVAAHADMIRRAFEDAPPTGP